MERLQMLVGSTVTVFLMGVAASIAIVPAGSVPDAKEADGATAPWCPPKPAPTPTPEMPSTVVTGTLTYVGTNYMVVRSGYTGAVCRDFVIPFSSVGMVLPGQLLR